jgi:hypothetical protein
VPLGFTWSRLMMSIYSLLSSRLKVKHSFAINFLPSRFVLEVGWICCGSSIRGIRQFDRQVAEGQARRETGFSCYFWERGEGGDADEGSGLDLLFVSKGFAGSFGDRFKVLQEMEAADLLDYGPRRRLRERGWAL